jgi:hypothetical protein
MAIRTIITLTTITTTTIITTTTTSVYRQPPPLRGHACEKNPCGTILPTVKDREEFQK